VGQAGSEVREVQGVLSVFFLYRYIEREREISRREICYINSIAHSTVLLYLYYICYTVLHSHTDEHAHLDLANTANIPTVTTHV